MHGPKGSPDGSAQPGFVRGLGLWDATAIVAGSMIGSGIFIVSQDVAARVGAPGWFLVVWALTGLMTVLGALAYGELAAMFPQAGGQYVYLREAFGPLWGFLYGWTLFLVIQAGSIAAVGVAFARYLDVVVGGDWSTWTQRGIAIAMIAVLTGINCLGLQAGKWVQNVFTALKALTLVALVVLGGLFLREGAALFSGGWFAGRALVDGAWQPLSGGALLAGLGVAMVGSLFAADAWNNATFVAGEVKHPQRNVGLSLALGAGAVIALYLLVNLAYLGTLTMDQIATAPNQRVGAEMMRAILGAPGAVVLAIAVLVSTFGCNNGLILTGARLVWAMARDGLFFHAAGDLGARSRVPVKALLIQGVWSSILVTTGSYSDLLDYVIFAALLFYVLTIAGLFVLRRTRPDAERPYRTWGYPVLPAIYLLAALVIMLALLVYKPGYTWPGLGIVIAGVPVFYGWRRWGRRA